MSSRASLLLLPVIYLGYISLGLPDGTFGVAWPAMFPVLGAPIGLAGTLVLVGTLLSAASSFWSGRIIARFHTGPVVLLSCLLTGTGLMLIAHAQNVWWLWLAAIPLGVGAGAVDTGLNGYVARHYSGRHMNWLHACWGIGATAGPFIMTQALAQSSGWRGGYFTIGCIQLSLALVFLCTLRLWDAVPLRSKPAAPGAPQRLDEAVPTTPANSEAGWLSAAMFALYVAFETTAGLWASTILVKSRLLDPAVAGLCTTAYYGAITAGRILVGFVVDRWGNRRLVSAGLALALVGAVLFVFAGSAWQAAMALVLLGLGFAPVYPCLMHEAPRRFAPDAVLVVIGRQSSASYLGGALMPALAGALAQVSLEGIAWGTIVGVVAMLAVMRRLNRIT